jgi:hypothetical protein
MSNPTKKLNSARSQTACRWALFLFSAALAVANLSAETISAQFNEKAISGDKAEGKDQVVFDLGHPVDFPTGSVSFWVRPKWFGGERSVIPLVNLLDKNGNGIRLSKIIWQKSVAIEVLSNWKPVACAYGEIADWIPGFSHHVAATWSKDALCLYLDGVNKSRFAELNG